MLNADLRENFAVKGTKVYDNSLILLTNKGLVKIQPYNDKIIRIVYTQNEDFSNKISYGTVKEPEICKWSFSENSDFIIFQTNSVKIQISKATCSFSYYDGKDNFLVKEPDNGGKFLEELDIYQTENVKIKKVETPDGIKEIVEHGDKFFDRKSYHTKLSLEFSDGEALYGLGQNEDGILNLRGTYQYLHQANLKIAMPFILSTKGYGILINTYSALTFHDDVYGSYFWTHADDEMDFFFIGGTGFDTIIQQYRILTGKAPMLPKWALGFVQSQERYESQEEILNVVKEYRKREIPLDAVVLDWRSWEDGLWGEKKFDLSRFPDVKAMTDELHSLGAHFMISIWPNMNEKTENYKEMKEKNCLLNGLEIYNAFDENARNLYWKQTNEGLFSKGIDGWWCDSSEPFCPEWRGEIKPQPEKQYDMYIEQVGSHLDIEDINAYSLKHAQGIYEGQRSVTNDKRVINLTRSSYIGQQRYATVMWSGDISANWRTLKNQIAAGLNFCASGLPYWTLDIGAFFVKKAKQWFWDGDYNDGTNDMGYRELFVRWLQYGAFLPMFRSHGTDFRREVWNFGEKGVIFYDSIVKFINLRYSLIPYIYSLAGKVTHNDYTFLRMLAFDFKDDKNVYNIKDQFMFGSCLMICPVTEPMYYAKNSVKLKNTDKTRSVYLPEGQVWYDFWNKTRYNGGKTVIANADINTMPIYVKAGSIIPMTNNLQCTADYTGESIDVNVYMGADGEFVLYDDEGDNYNYEKGEFVMIPFKWDDKNRTLTIDKSTGSYKNMVAVRTFKIYAIENCTKKHVCTIEYNGMPIKTELPC